MILVVLRRNHTRLTLKSEEFLMIQKVVIQIEVDSVP